MIFLTFLKVYIVKRILKLVLTVSIELNPGPCESLFGGLQGRDRDDEVITARNSRFEYVLDGRWGFLYFVGGSQGLRVEMLPGLILNLQNKLKKLVHFVGQIRYSLLTVMTRLFFPIHPRMPNPMGKAFTPIFYASSPARVQWNNIIRTWLVSTIGSTSHSSCLGWSRRTTQKFWRQLTSEFVFTLPLPVLICQWR